MCLLIDPQIHCQRIICKLLRFFIYIINIIIDMLTLTIIIFVTTRTQLPAC